LEGRVKRLRKQLRVSENDDPDGIREQYIEGKREIAKHAREIRAARDRGEEISDPLDKATGAELQAHIVSYGSFEEAPVELMEAFERRIASGEAGPHQEKLREIAALGLSLSLACFQGEAENTG
jgi:hypothetical protein